jgi:hypothetical protein
LHGKKKISAKRPLSPQSEESETVINLKAVKEFEETSEKGKG